MLSFFLRVIFAFFAVSVAAQQPCYTACKFSFCSYGAAEFAVAFEPGAPFSNIMCMRPPRRLGKVYSFGEAHVMPSRMAISEWKPPGLQQGFGKNFFKPFHFINTAYTGMTHEKTQRNQRTFLNQTCFAVPITSYQIIDTKNQHVQYVNNFTADKFTDCIALKTFVF